MKKAAVSKDVVPPSPIEEATPVEPEVPSFGFGKFEYRDQSTYLGNWKCFGGRKMKHGHGKAVYAGIGGKGQEEFEGDWVDDLMHGYGKYTFTSGGVYSGEWKKGKMSGKGKMVNGDGTSYEGDWCENVMSGEGIYIDIDKVKWEGIFINGSYESKIQKKLKLEKEVEDKVQEY